MQKIIDYLNALPSYVTTLIISAAAIVVIFIIIVICRKALAKKHAKAVATDKSTTDSRDNTSGTEISKEGVETDNSNCKAQFSKADVIAASDKESSAESCEDKQAQTNSAAISDCLGQSPDSPMFSAETPETPSDSDVAAAPYQPSHYEPEFTSDCAIDDNSAADDQIKAENAQPEKEKQSQNAQINISNSEQKPRPIKEAETQKSEDKPQKNSDNATQQQVKQDRQQPKQQPQSAAIVDKADRYQGKWSISKSDGRFTAALKASNGEIMLQSESYTSLSGMKSGIDTLKKNIAADNYAINVDKNGNFVFKIFSTAKRLLCVGEGYSTREQCEKAFSSVKRFSVSAQIVVEDESKKDKS